MPLDVWLVAPPLAERPKKAVRRHLLALDGDGLWLFLERFWPPSSSNGQAVDLYDNAHFAGADLATLRAGLLRAKMTAESRSESWREAIGVELEPVEKTLYQIVRREAVVAAIDTLLAGVTEATDRRGRMVFEGD